MEAVHTYRTRPAHGFGWAALACLAVGIVFGLLGTPLLFGLDIHLGSRFYPMEGLGWVLALKSLFFALTAVILMSAGWVAEVAIRAPLSAEPASQYAVEERLE